MLPLAPPDRALGAYGWVIAALCVVLAFVIGAQRLSGPSEPSFGSMFAGSIVALIGIALVEWLAGGRASPYHQLYALPVIYAAAVQPRRRALIVLGLVAVVIWAPLLYAPPASRLPADIAGQLLLLVVLALAGRIVFTLLRAQRSGLRRAREQAHRLARRDSLTGLGNRLGLEETLEVEVARARRQGSALSLIIGDLDGFKAINDAFGHSGGDECLRRVAKAMGDASRTEDQCFRWGGDEFVVVLPDTTEPEAAEVRRRVCIAASAVCASPNGGEVRLTCGTAELGPEDSVETLLAAADQVLLRFKRRAERVSAAGTAHDHPEDGD
jgi:diguanylate cyclase (GGDEF)-like protein